MNAIDAVIHIAGQNGNISIETDSTYSARRNANCSNTFALGVNNHQIVRAVILSKSKEPIPHRHEHVATERIITKLKQSGLTLKNIVHDRNYQVSKVIQSATEDDIITLNESTEQNEFGM